jgi:hypothetical protein
MTRAATLLVPIVQTFTPRLDVLPDEQRRLWKELSALPVEFVLYGGTAIALQLGHRQSIDFDFFLQRDLDVPALQARVPFLTSANVIQLEPNTLSVVVDRGAPVKVSFFGVPRLPRLLPPLIAADNGVKVASLVDLAGTKASVVQLRAEAKDYLDLDALNKLGGVSLALALAAAQRLYGPTFNAQSTLKALSYFKDGNLGSLPEPIQRALAAAARDVDLDQLPVIP